MDSKICPEEVAVSKSPPKSILMQREGKKRSITYTPGSVAGIQKKKKVTYVDRTTNSSLCQVFNYEQVEIIETVDDQKSTSCACLVF